MEILVRPKQVIYWPNFVSRRRKNLVNVHTFPKLHSSSRHSTLNSCILMFF